MKRTKRLGAIVWTLVITGVLLLTQVTPAQAYSGAFFHTQSIGNTGTDVRVIQLLLGISPDGVFGSQTRSAVRAFQASKHLSVDGIVGPNTWNALTPTLHSGSKDNAVKALQLLLNQKRNAGLTMDGSFGQKTRDAVINFQRHANLSADGVVGPTTWQNLVWHYEYVNFNAGICDKNPDGNGNANWGTAAAIGQLEAAVRAFSRTGHGRVPLGDISLEHGGDILVHASHEVGLDVDIWPIAKNNQQCTDRRLGRATPIERDPLYDRAATRQLIKMIYANAPGHIKVIFFNDPVLINEGLTRYYPNHNDHFHVRYCEKAHPNQLYNC